MSLRNFIIQDVCRIIPDKLWIKIKYYRVFHRFPDLKDPKTFNEKLQWLKLHDRNPEYTTMVDKYEVKKYVADRIGEEHIIPILGVWDSFDEIDFDKLPNQFVLKCTHDSGGLVICRDKSKLDIKKAKAKINNSLKLNYFYQDREWPYKNVKPRIIAEKYISLDAPKSREYKFFCFNGIPTYILICKGNALYHNRTNDFYDINFKRIPVQHCYPNSDTDCEKPKEYEQLLEIARILSKGKAHLRVDLYVINGKIYFGEMTFYHCSGCCKFNPESFDRIWGNQITLPDIVGKTSDCK